MIKISKHLYLNPLTVAFFIICLLYGRKETFIVSYLSMIFHELGHLSASLFIGLLPEKIAFHPFGVNLRLKSKIVYNLCDELILYLSGPLVNLTISLIFLIFFRDFYLFDYVYALNIMLFLINMLPIFPLDGGVILKKILNHYVSQKTSNAIMKLISSVFSAAVLALGLYAVYVTKYNYSIIFMSILLFANIFTSSEKYPENFLKKLMYCEKRKNNLNGMKGQIIMCDNEDSYLKCLKKSTSSKYTILALLDSDKKIKGFKTETQIINDLLNPRI